MSLNDKKYNLHRDCNLSQTSSSGLSDCEDSSDSELEKLKKLNYKKYLPSPRAARFTKSQICKHFGASKKKEIIASTPVFKIRRQKSDSLLEPSISLSPIEKQYEPIETTNLLLKKSVGETHNLEILKKKKRPSDIAFKIENKDHDDSPKKDLKRPPYPLINLVRLPIKKSYTTNVKSTQISSKSVNNISLNYENENSHKLKNFFHSKRYTKDILEENVLKGQGDVVAHEKLNENTNCSLLRSHNFTKESKKIISNIEKKKNTLRDANDSDLEIAPSKSLVKCKKSNLCEVDFSNEESENEDCMNTDQNLNSKSQRSKIEEKNENQLNLCNSKSLMKITKGKKRHSVKKNANINQSQLIVDDVPSKNSTNREKAEGNSDGSSLEPIFNAIRKEVIKFFGDKDSSNVDNLNPFQKGLKHKSDDEIETPKEKNNRQLEEVEDRNIQQPCPKSKKKAKTIDDATQGYFCGLFENNEAKISNVQEKENISPISRDNPHTGKMHISNKSIPKKLFDDKKGKRSFSYFCDEDSSSSKKSQQRGPETTLSKTMERNLRSNQKKLQETHKNSKNNSKKEKIDTMEEKQKVHKTLKYDKHENKRSISIDFEQLQNEKINKRYNFSSNLSMASNQDSELLGIRKSTRIRKQTRKLCIETLVLTSKPYYRRKIHEDDRNSNNPSEKYSFKVPTSKPLKVKKQQAKISEVVQQGSGVAQPDSGYSSNESKKTSKSTRRHNSINFENEEENGQFSTKLGNLHPIVEENDEKAINNDINSEVKKRRTQRHGKRKTSKVKVLQGNKENNQLHEELKFQQQMSSDNDQFIDPQEVSNCHLNHTKAMETQQKLPNIANLSSVTLRSNESQCISDFQNHEDFNALNTICYAVNNYAQRSNWHYSGPKLIPVQGENGVHMGYSVCNQNLGFCTFSMGFLQVDANCLKKQCYFKTSYAYYIVTEGQAYVTVDQKKKELGINDSFFVPLGKDYSICNRNNTDKLILAFTVIKAPRSLP